MTARRVTTLLIGTAGAAGWLSVALTLRDRGSPSAPALVNRSESAASSRARFEVSFDRLGSRSQGNRRPLRNPTRNPFRFITSRAPLAALVPPDSEVLTPAPGPVVSLAGIAEDLTADGPRRTAIISADGELFLVREGEQVAVRYRVARIGVDAVELQDAVLGAPIRIGLK